ncbi:MAG: hypothetical protein GY756_19105 [bacterium]|nr:hypothetical protein [bacterium]
MRNILIASLLFFVGIMTLTADDSASYFEMTNGKVASGESNFNARAQKLRNFAQGINVKEQVVPNASKRVNEAINKYNKLKTQLKNTYTELANVYDTGQKNEIRQLESRVWFLEQKIKLAEKKQEFAYQTGEIEKMLKEYPKSKDLSELIKESDLCVSDYEKVANQIIDLDAKQLGLESKMAKLQKKAEIIRQKEILNKMNQEYNNQL